MTALPKRPRTDQRQGDRIPIRLPVRSCDRKGEDHDIVIENISPSGFMASGDLPGERGERIDVRLPGVGHIEAHLVWRDAQRGGFQLERVLRPQELAALLESLPETSVRSFWRPGHGGFTALLQP